MERALIRGSFLSFSLESFKNSRRVCFRNSMYIDNSDFRITRLDLEVSGLAAFFLFIWSGEQMAALVSLTNSGYFDEAVNSIFGGALGWGARSLIIIILNGCAIFLTFAVWYYLVTCWGDITVIGIRQFVRERSLLYRCFGTICDRTEKYVCFGAEYCTGGFDRTFCARRQIQKHGRKRTRSCHSQELCGAAGRNHAGRDRRGSV